jgi:hypothetical protein
MADPPEAPRRRGAVGALRHGGSKFAAWLLATPAWVWWGVLPGVAAVLAAAALVLALVRAC